MTDIVKRLRSCCGIRADDPDCCCAEAADEIERLREEIVLLKRLLADETERANRYAAAFPP